MRLARILPARRALPRAVRHVTIGHAAYARQTPEFLLVSVSGSLALCRAAYGASGHCATMRPKILETDIQPYFGN